MDISLHGELNRTQLKQLQTMLANGELPPAKQQRLLQRIAKRGVIPAAKRHVREQKNVDGSSFAERRYGNRPLLKGLPKFLKVHDMPSAKSVRIYAAGRSYRQPHNHREISVGAVGYIQSHGVTFTVNASQLKTDAMEKASKEPCSRRQAIKLRKLGYTVSDKKRGTRRKPSTADIRTSLTKGQAGVIIRSMEGIPSKSCWTITIPPRQFLGVSNEEFARILSRQLQGINYGWQTKPQDIKRK
ncbi:hypothetical protein AT328_002250 [Escherichia coli]|uniref:Uncharacterized protein n=2 Tax=Enterobacteriaceae TaxID=543 RepID=A0A377HBS5_ECOLX|nr:MULTISPECIES: hypothetical protein [Enterobacteriaceae]EHD3441809.1 hypothetical protein [Escherichia coli O152]EIQ08908.1 putative phage protein [Shigella flexneri 2850-71]EAB1026938.1 hypothetical protein [Shigella sonnei]EAB6513067.1 hypothetical protein [Shigella flexneri]EFG9376003.1 hypothetical protein [Escherichia coli]